MVQAEELFVAERPRLLGLAYRMVGSLADAEDIVSDAWARWCATGGSQVESPQAWLTTVTTRLAIDWLRRSRHDRETYVGPWLPEPVVTEPGPEERAELADSLTLGFLTLLERLDPLQRAVFLMADVFDLPFAHIAEAVGKPPTACRQIASRARRRLRQAPARSRPEDRQLVDEVLVAIGVGNMQAVLDRLAPNVVCVTDGGANRYAARRPVVGPMRVARFLINLARRYRTQMTVEAATINCEPGIIVRLSGELDFVAAFEVQADLVHAVWLIRNPDKLRLVTSAPQLV